jgi:hypothetical protein
MTIVAGIEPRSNGRGGARRYIGPIVGSVRYRSREVVSAGDCRDATPELVHDGCARRWHRPAGVTHRATGTGGNCAPDGGPYGAWGAGWYYPPHIGAVLPAMRLELSIKSGLGEKLALLPLREP